MRTIVYGLMGYTTPSAAQTALVDAMLNDEVQRVTSRREFLFRLRYVDVSCTLAVPTPDLPANFPGSARVVTALDDGRPVPHRPAEQDIAQEGDPAFHGGMQAACYDVAYNTTTDRWTFVPQPEHANGTQTFRVRYLAASDLMTAVTDSPPWNPDYHRLCWQHAISQLAVGGSFDPSISANARAERDRGEISLFHTGIGGEQQQGRLPRYGVGTRQYPRRGQGG